MKRIIKYVNPVWLEGFGYTQDSEYCNKDIRLLDDIETVKSEIDEVLSDLGEVHEEKSFKLQCPFCGIGFIGKTIHDERVRDSFYDHLKKWCRSILKKIKTPDELIVGNLTAKDLFEDEKGWKPYNRYTFPTKVDCILEDSNRFFDIGAHFGYSYDSKEEAEKKFLEYKGMLKSLCVPIKKVFFECDYCGDVFINEEYASKHILNKHKKESGLLD